MLDYKSAMLIINDDVVGADYSEEAVIKVSLPEQSTVTVKPSSVKSEAVKDIIVEYEVEATRYGGNSIRIDLPGDWEPAYGDGSYVIDDIDLMASPKVDKVTSLAAGDDKTETSYVTVEYDAARGSAATGALVFADAEIVEVVVAGDMMIGDTVTVTFHNLEVEEVTAVDEGKAYKSAQLTVSDDVVGSDYTADTVIMVTPPTLSEVSVDPTSVTAEALKDIEVTYAVQDTVKDNTITTELPRDWDPGFGRDFW